MLFAGGIALGIHPTQHLAQHVAHEPDASPLAMRNDDREELPRREGDVRPEIREAREARGVGHLAGHVQGSLGKTNMVCGSVAGGRGRPFRAACFRTI